LNPVALILAGLFVLTYGAVAIFVLRHRVLGRLAMREAVRRKGQAVLVVAGLMVGTGTITAALVAADSAGDTSLDIAFRSWGFVDLTVTGGDQFFAKDVSGRLAASPAVAGVTDGVSPGIDLAGSVSDLDTRQGASTITLVGFDPGSQEPFGAYILTNGRRTLGRDLSPGDVLLSRVLASKLGAKTGDRIQVSVDTTRPAGAPPVGLRVTGITRPQGPGGYTLGSVVFAPLSTAQRIAGTDLINIVRISAPGGIRDSVAAAHRATPTVERAVGALGSQIPLEVREAKAHEIDSAEGSSVLFRAMLIGMSALVVAVGAALMVNLIGMLAQERRSRLGVLRALGLKRGRLVGLSVTEGALYSLAAGVAGTAAGAAAGRLVAARFGDVFAAYAGSDYDWTYSFSLKASTLVAAFTAGTVLTLAVIFFASRHTSRMTIVAAIRDLPEPPAGTKRRPWMRRARLAIFAAIGLVALVQPYLPRLAGGTALILVLSSVARPRPSQRTHATLTGLAIAGWCLAMIAVSKPGPDPGAFIAMFVVALLTSVFGLTILATANLHVAETTVGLLGRASAGLSAGTPGQKITLQGQDGPVTFTIAGSQPTGLLPGVFGTERALRPLRAAPPGATMLLDIRNPARAAAVARTVERSLFAQGVDAAPVQALLDQAYRADQSLLSVIDVLMRMGLVVGILGLGIVALRVVTERRHVIGILRAIGYKRRTMILALLTESAVTTTIGAAVGIVAGVAMGYLFYRQGNSHSGFGIDLASIGSALGLIYLAVLLVTVGPAWRASRIPPAEAIRHTE